ncbi:hypothetical protein BDR04DRAFT_1158381 [Suillus decipiens]|nr:hypothetical protein BDR04DRAFT_1158381 [Suillus decipiens]
MPDGPYFPYHCSRCSNHKDKFIYQTQQVIHIHSKKYAPRSNVRGGDHQMPLLSACGPLIPQTNAPNCAPALGTSIRLTTLAISRGEPWDLHPLSQDNLQPDPDPWEFFDVQHEHDADPQADPLPAAPIITQELPLIRCQQQQCLTPPDQNFVHAAPPDVCEPGVDQDEADAPSLVAVTFNEKAEVRYAYFTVW